MSSIPSLMHKRLGFTIIFIVGFLVGHTQKSFSLEGAIAYAIEHRCEIEVAALEVKSAEAEINEFKSIGLPQVNAKIDYNYYFYSPINPIEDFITPAIFGVLVQEFPGQVTPPTTEPETFEFSFFNRHNLSANIDASMLLFDGSYLTGLEAAKVFKELSKKKVSVKEEEIRACLLYTSPSPRDQRGSRMPSSA